MLKSLKELGETLNALLPAALGVTVLVLFGIFIKFLLNNTGASDATWNRFIYIFSAVQSVALAAATFFFGKTVSSEQQKATDAKKGKEVAVKGLQQVAARAEEKRRVQASAETTPKELFEGLDRLSRLRPDLTLAHPDFREHLDSAISPAARADGDLDEIASLARSFAQQANSFA